ncbi:hypothetical protein NM208_g5648 [Fusarium decemcellulare]|uniref:Uncharacterized protein n=1 Tax=Fusarium decemcellulare TaxID=57161 RepID=A0ACC1SGA2_9HYPO|nr:hypothetical protein NM208_g5648 [Fusarium decemcellulare]
MRASNLTRIVSFLTHSFPFLSLHHPTKICLPARTPSISNSNSGPPSQLFVMSQASNKSLDWEIRLIQSPKTAPWQVPLTGASLAKLLKGFRPRDMDDKWVCYVDGPSDKGNIVIHLCRSWTSYEIYRVKARVLTHQDGTIGNPEKDGGEVYELEWEGEHGTELEAKDMATNLCHGLMGCDLRSS